MFFLPLFQFLIEKNIYKKKRKDVAARSVHWATVTATAFCNTQSPLVRGYIGRNGQICVCVSVCLCGGGRRWAMVANSDRRIHSFDSLWLLRELRRKKTGTKQQNMRTKKVEEISAVCAVAC